MHYLPPELLEAMQRVGKRAKSAPEGAEEGDLSNMSQEDAVALATEIVNIAHEIRRLSTH